MSKPHPALTLVTSRLVLRPVAPQDARATAALVTPDVAANLSTWACPMSEAQALERIERSQKATAGRQGIDFGICSRDAHELLGWIGLAANGDEARLGYWLGTPFRDRALMKEAAAAAVPAAAAFLGVRSVGALVLPGNARSIAVLDALSFAPEGEETILIETTGQSRTCLRYRLDCSPG